MTTATRQSYWWDDTVKYGLSVVIPDPVVAVAEPISVAEAKANSRVDLDDENAWFRDAIVAARELCETFIKRRFVNRTLLLTLDTFPPHEFYLPCPPLVSVTTLKYKDANGTLTTLSSSAYTVDTYTEPGRIVPAYNTSWPMHRQDTNAIQITYVAGYGAASAVPQSIKQAIKFTVSDWYENREQQGELPLIAKTLLRRNSWGYLP